MNEHEGEEPGGGEGRARYGPERRHGVFVRDIVPWLALIVQLLVFVFALGELWARVAEGQARIERMEQTLIHILESKGGR